MIGNLITYGIAILCAIPALVLGCECLLALFPLRSGSTRYPGRRPRIAVVVPAHNEAMVICATIRSIRAQLSDDDRLIVIADNCDDSTASVAFQAGALVWERCDATRRGKGFAIRYALTRLLEDPPEVVISIDADCILAPECIDRLARTTLMLKSPVQAAYLMHAAKRSSAIAEISSFAVMVKNYVRPRGLQRAGLPCLITGSGMAYPWHVLHKVPHPDAHIVEDMRYAVDLTLAGHPPRPCMEALVHSRLPTNRLAVESQRTRWEHGHLATILAEGPRLLAAFLRSGSLRILTIGLELTIPPLSLFVPITCVAGSVLGWSAWFYGTHLPFAVWAISATTAAVGVTLAWAKFGRRMLPFRRVISIPKYVVAKVPIYRQFLRARQRTWVRTDRDPHGHLPHKREIDVVVPRGRSG